MKIIILTPVYNDWQSVYKLIDEINNLSLNKEFEIQFTYLMIIQIMIVQILKKV